MQLKCSARSQIPHCRHRVTGQILGGIAFGLVHNQTLWFRLNERGGGGGGGLISNIAYEGGA